MVTIAFLVAFAAIAVADKTPPGYHGYVPPGLPPFYLEISRFKGQGCADPVGFFEHLPADKCTTYDQACASVSFTGPTQDLEDAKKYGDCHILAWEGKNCTGEYLGSWPNVSELSRSFCATISCC